MKWFEILFKIDFIFLRKTYVLLKPHLLDGFFIEFSYMSRCHKKYIVAWFRRPKRGGGKVNLKRRFPTRY